MNFIKNCVLVESIKQMFFNLQTRCFWLRVGWGIKQKQLSNLPKPQVNFSKTNKKARNHLHVHLHNYSQTVNYSKRKQLKGWLSLKTSPRYSFGRFLSPSKRCSKTDCMRKGSMTIPTDKLVSVGMITGQQYHLGLQLCVTCHIAVRLQE